MSSVCLLSAPARAQAPPNDQCANAATISSLPASYSGVNWASATDDIGASCTQMSDSYPTKYGVWYQYTPATAQDIQVLVTPSACYPSIAAIFTGSCSSLTELACSNSDPLTYSLTAGVTYRFLIADWYNFMAGAPSGTLGATFRALPAPPANDACASATVVPSFPASFPDVDYTTATADIDTSCNDDTQTGHGFWYTFTPPVSGILHQSFSFDDCGENMTAALFAGSACGSLVEQGCTNYGTDGLWPVVGGTQYWLLAGMRYSWPEPTYPVNLDLELLPPLTNDYCGDAIDAGTLPFSATNIPIGAATPDLDVSCNAAGDSETGNGVWYTYTPSTSHMLGIDHHGDDGTVVALFTGTCGTLSELACDAYGRLNYPVEAGETYHVLLGAADTSHPPTFSDLDMVEAPANDDCSDATVIPTQSFSESVDTTHASYSYSDPENAGCGQTYGVDGSVWYTFETSSSGAVTVSTCGSDYDTTLSVYTGGCEEGSAVLSTCNDNDGISCTGAQASVVFGATAGVHYWVEVGTPWTEARAASAGALTQTRQLSFSFDSSVPVVDPAYVYSDGFETGNTTHWSSTSP